MLTNALIFLAAGIILALLEVFLPTGGILGFFAAAAFAAEIYFAFQIENEIFRLVILVFTLIIVPVIVIYGMYLFPKTPIGKRIILKPSNDDDGKKGVEGVSEEDYSRLIGKTGIAVTPLRPSGIAEIDEERYSVVSSGKLIEADADIIVTEIQGNSIVVDKFTE